LSTLDSGGRSGQGWISDEGTTACVFYYNAKDKAEAVA